RRVRRASAPPATPSTSSVAGSGVLTRAFELSGAKSAMLPLALPGMAGLRGQRFQVNCDGRNPVDGRAEAGISAVKVLPLMLTLPPATFVVPLFFPPK